MSSSESSERESRALPSSWAKLTWDHLEQWAGNGSVSRGRAYQRGGRVRDLRLSRDGRLLATVQGTERYAVTVSLTFDRRRPTIESLCTCPIGSSRCKHAIATIAEYLQAIAEERELPRAAEDDPRWAELDDVGGEDDGDFDSDSDDEGDEYEDDDEELMPPARRAGRKAPSRRGPTAVNWEDQIARHVREKPQTELAELVLSLARRFPEIRDEFRERIALLEGDGQRLVAEARREIRKVTAEVGWQNHWDDNGFTPDYSRLRHRLERLREMEHFDEVVSLGRELIQRGLQQVAGSNDEGETLTEFATCLPVVFQALASSSLSRSDRLLFAIDAELEDEYDAIGESAAAIFAAEYTSEDWSAVARALAGRLESAVPNDESKADHFIRDYHRDRVVNWLARALEESGRGEEVQALLESEARTTSSYQRLVKHLLERDRPEEAERWAREGIAATAADYPGIAAGLAETCRDLARRRKQWDVVAGHAAHSFFDHPGSQPFDELIRAAKKARVEEGVRAAALHFLETGAMPYRVPMPRSDTPTASRSRSALRKRSTAVRPAGSAAASLPRPDQVRIDPSWPLPVPDCLLALLNRREREPRPHLDVLLDMAIRAKRPDDVLRWYDKMRAERSTYGSNAASGHADRVAEAVKAAHPERAIEIYRAALDAQLPHAQPSAYDAAARYLRKLRPIYESMGRGGDWTALVASIREKYRNRPRFMEALDTVEGRTIVQSRQPRQKRR